MYLKGQRGNTPPLFLFYFKSLHLAHRSLMSFGQMSAHLRHFCPPPLPPPSPLGDTTHNLRSRPGCFPLWASSHNATKFSVGLTANPPRPDSTNAIAPPVTSSTLSHLMASLMSFQCFSVLPWRAPGGYTRPWSTQRWTSYWLWLKSKRQVPSGEEERKRQQKIIWRWGRRVILAPLQSAR